MSRQAETKKFLIQTYFCSSRVAAWMLSGVSAPEGGGGIRAGPGSLIWAVARTFAQSIRLKQPAQVRNLRILCAAAQSGREAISTMPSANPLQRFLSRAKSSQLGLSVSHLRRVRPG
jgi:hypothetical protein